ncbi:5-methyltetrahydropteroyltriglutamate--homocysteine methyltransferase [Candidatus Brocadiaceae bacterium B188]|nr:cobalamin-independent methionine synthase II family protein [Candidatus Brocadia sapporoensis]RZV59395.1 MAG: vitamin-B12 independent methionine synthase [Candidatus Brocadia sp. BROELEC01]TWU53600.1 5-methyltetrahydropteroyltriglutamate--homocysteine methyltransferase [Candidatus Brocadiaceae bacterium B188]
MLNIPLFPVTMVGSLPRSKAVIKALGRRQKGLIGDKEFDSIVCDATLEALRLQEEAGVDIVTDGEQRRDNFYSFVAGHIDGIQLMSLTEMLNYVEDKATFERLLNALDVPAFALKNPVVTGKLKRKHPLVLNDYLFLRQHTNKPIKTTLPGPYLLTRSMWVKSLSYNFYPDKISLGNDVVDILREELMALCNAGCTFIQFDEPALAEVAFTGPHETHTFMCAALSEKRSPEEELDFAVDLLNRVVAGISGKMKTALHVCRGNWSQREDVLLRGAYSPLIPYFNRMNIHQFVLECATERAGSIDALADLLPDKEIGLGVVDPRTTRVETVDFVVNNVKSLIKHRHPKQIYLNPDCGFGTFADRPVNTEEIILQKLHIIRQASETLRSCFGML